MLSWTKFLEYCSNPGAIPIIVGVVLSWIAEYAGWYQALAAKWKRLVFLGLCWAVPILAAILGLLTAGWDAGWDATFWPAIQAGFLAFSSGTLTHLPKLKKAPVPEEAA